MIVASRIDQGLSKDEILEIYLNSIYLGRGAWGIDTAARSYFKKPASALGVTEGAMLAAMAKGPSYFSPDRYPERTRERFAYVLKRMQEDKIAGAEAINPGVTGVPRIVPYERPRREAGFHFVDHLLREAKTLVGMQSLTSESYTVRSTINAKLQRAAEAPCRTAWRATRRPATGRSTTAPSSISARPTCASPPSRARVRCGAAV